jgi:hypothetical protein
MSFSIPKVRSTGRDLDLPLPVGGHRARASPEGSVVGQGGPVDTGPAKSLLVDLHVLGREGSLRIVGAPVEYLLQDGVVPLAEDQLRQEGKPEEEDVGLRPPPPEGRVQHHQAPDAVRVVEGHLPGDDASPVVPHQVEAIHVQRVHELAPLLAQRAQGVGAPRLVRFAVALEIGRDHPELLRENRDDAPPAVPELGKAVEEKDGASFPGRDVVNAHTADCGVIVSEEGELHERFGSGSGRRVFG